MIRLTIPSIEDDDLQAVRDVLRTGYLIQGPRVADFERAIGEYLGVAHAVAVSNCTSALHLSLLALGVGPGDLVVVTAYSWIATANVIELCGARPVFVDIQADTFNMDPVRLGGRLEDLMADPRTHDRVRAVIPVHTFGQMADMSAITELAEKHGLPVVEDAACSLGAAWAGRQAGTWGRAACFSFHPRKAITTGEGGMVVTSDGDLARCLRMLRNHGLDPDAETPDFVRPGFNCRMTEFQAALGITQLAKLDRIVSARRRLAGNYDAQLAGSPVSPPTVPANSRPVYQSYVVLLPQGTDRTRIIADLEAEDIETTIGTINIPMTAYYRQTYGYSEGDFTATDDAAARSLTLPLYELLTPADQERVVGTLKSLLSSSVR